MVLKVEHYGAFYLSLNLTPILRKFKISGASPEQGSFIEKNKQKIGKVFCNSSFKQGFVNEQSLFNTWFWINFFWNGSASFCWSDFR